MPRIVVSNDEFLMIIDMIETRIDLIRKEIKIKGKDITAEDLAKYIDWIAQYVSLRERLKAGG